MPELPLSPLTVLDLTTHRSGPSCARFFADWGADVIKIEQPGSGADDGMGAGRDGFDFQNLHRNKRSIVLDLKQQEGKAILERLVRKADILVENYRPDVKHRLGIDYESLSALNPRLIYGSISGFGQDGPYRERPGVDQIAQGMGGLMSITGLPGQGPVRVGIPIADLTSGMFLAIGMLMALYERERSGRGQWVTTSLLQAQIAMLDFQAARYLKDKEVPKQAGNDHPTGVPTGVFKTKDGHINIAASGQEMFGRLCRAIEAPELLKDERYTTGKLRSQNRAALHDALEAYTVKSTSAEWIGILNRAGVPCGPIYAMDEVFADPQVRHLAVSATVEHARLGEFEAVDQAMRLSRTPTRRQRKGIGERGRETEEVLRELGYDAAAIARLRERKII